MSGATVPVGRGGGGADLQLPGWLVVAAALGGALVVGFAMGHNVKMGIAAAVALVYVPLALLNLQLAIVLWLPSVSLLAVTALNVGPNVAALMILAAWVGTLAVPGSTVAARMGANGRYIALMSVLVLWVLLSLAWALRPELGTETFFGWIAAGAIVLVVSTTLTDRRYLRLAAGAFVVGVVISVIMGLLGGEVDDESARITGGSGDPNFLAAGIVPAIALVAGLAVGAAVRVRIAAVAAVILLTIGLAATESRGGLVAAVVAAAAILIVAKRHRAWAVGFLLCIVGVAGTWFATDPAAWERFSDFSDSTGRTELWAAAWEMWKDHPFVGVGIEGFMDNAATYARELGPLEYATFLTEDLRVVHSTYLELLAETGLVGLLLFVGVVLMSVRFAWRAAGLFERIGDGPMAALARSLVAAQLAMLASAAFVSGATDRRLWVVLALGPALFGCARRGERQRSERARVVGPVAVDADRRPRLPATTRT